MVPTSFKFLFDTRTELETTMTTKITPSSSKIIDSAKCYKTLKTSFGGV